MKTIVFGPPGTGKTHTLLEKVDEYLKTTNPDRIGYFAFTKKAANRSEEHTSELQSQSTISYAVFCLKKKKQTYVGVRRGQ